MAAPYRRTVLPAARPAPQPGRAAPRAEPGVGPYREPRKVAGARRRGFVVLVVIPVLLMLGSVYLHTVAAGLEGRAAELEERLDRAATEGERLEIRVTQLSSPERVRERAAEDLDMQAPAGADLEVYEGVDREDGIKDGDQRSREATR